MLHTDIKFSVYGGVYCEHTNSKLYNFREFIRYLDILCRVLLTANNEAKIS